MTEIPNRLSSPLLPPLISSFSLFPFPSLSLSLYLPRKEHITNNKDETNTDRREKKKRKI